MNSTLPLRARLPVYDEYGGLENESLNITSVDSNEKQNHHQNETDWVENALAKGEAGEKAVELFLTCKYNAYVEKKPDYAGYDYYVEFGDEKRYIEVKTSSHNHFYISRNEIMKAKELGEKYYIYYVQANMANDEIICERLFVIQRPFDYFGLDWIDTADITSDIATIKVQTIEVSFNDFSDCLEEKDFKDYINY